MKCRRMVRWPTPLLLLLLLLLAPGRAVAGPASAEPASDPRRSGFDDMTPATQAMQRDDFANPAWLWVLDGEALWRAPAGSAAKSCADCHGAAEHAMRGVAARHPAYDPARGLPLTLGQRIAQCRTRRQGAAALAPEAREALALEAYVALQSRGLPIRPDADPRAAPFRERGRRHYAERMGQLDFACADCHDRHAGGRLGGSVIPQGHPTGYPIYRLEWQGVGSLQRRLRNCMTGVRAEPYAWGAIELTELELWLAARAAGMRMETPAVRP